MVTAESARQETPDRISLVQPKADIGTKDGRWLMLQSREGTYAPRSSQVDLRGDVVLYRDDGSTARTESASIDLKGGAATGAEPISVSGPFGTIEAEGGFAVLDKGDIVQFSGPAKALLNGASSPRAHSPGAPAQGTSR